jgi:hypothetical protein
VVVRRVILSAFRPNNLRPAKAETIGVWTGITTWIGKNLRQKEERLSLRGDNFAGIEKRM